MTTLPWQASFVVEAPSVEPESHDTWDLYLPSSGAPQSAPRPLVVLVHGGPLPPNLPRTPRTWPGPRGYATLLAHAGAAALTVDHPLHAMDGYAAAYRAVVAAVEAARLDRRVDPSRVGVWLFSGAGPMAAPLLASPPAWLRCLALSYPILDDRPDWPLPQGFHPLTALAGRGARVPLVMTTVGRQDPSIVGGVDRFLATAAAVGWSHDVIHVAEGAHAYDVDATSEASRDAVCAGVDRVLSRLRDAPT